jgi:hypothetical protein
MDIKNILSNFTIQDILIIILIIIILYLLFKNKTSETFVDASISSAINEAVESKIQQIYDLDVEAMRNLGAISKTILTGANYSTAGTPTGTPGTLTIPANLIVLGSITYNDATTGSIASPNNTPINSNNISIAKTPNNVIKLGTSTS